MKNLTILITVLLIAGCSAIDLTAYKDNEPKLELFDYFLGETRGWGIVQDRKGVLLRQFEVDIEGIINERGELVLNEEFIWSDGEESTRTWILSSSDPHKKTHNF